MGNYYGKHCFLSELRAFELHYIHFFFLRRIWKEVQILSHHMLGLGWLFWLSLTPFQQWNRTRWFLASIRSVPLPFTLGFIFNCFPFNNTSPDCCWSQQSASGGLGLGAAGPSLSSKTKTRNNLIRDLQK